MSLEAGTSLAHFQILEKLGEGGMGEVYRASDEKLGRDVAIKVLPDVFAEDEERLKRFQREAKVLASLNHPNIAAIYGLEQSGGTHYLVLELVPGETLAERIARGPIPFEEAKEIAIKIAEALEEAHERGIVHRDLKPANVKITPDGKVKVLDFGLAKAFAEELKDVDSSLSPTITRDATRAGVILGTAAYMSPEQAKGKNVDARTDVFAFGVVMFEMLSGKKAFPGEDVSEVLAAVIKLEPEWSLLPAVPMSVQHTLRRCVDKNPRRRLHAIADARIEIEDAGEEAPLDALDRQPRRRWLIAAALGMAVIGFAIGWLWPRETPPTAIERFVVPLDPELRILDSELAFSPDGRDLVFSGSRQGDWQLYRCSRGELDVLPVPGTMGGMAPFFSPEGNWLGFYTVSGELKKMSWSPQGAPLTLTDNATTWGTTATWSEDDSIVFSGSSQLLRIDADGGAPTPITAPSDDAPLQVWPQLLPHGEWIVFSVAQGPDTADVVVASSKTGEWHTLIEDARQARYVPTGNLLYVSAQALWASRFDAERARLQGSPVRLMESVLCYAVGQDGSLGYVEGSFLDEHRLVWVGRDGVETAALEDVEGFCRPRLSPEGRRLVVEIRETSLRGDLWLYDLGRGTRTRLTFEDMNTDAVWSPNGAHLTYATGQGNLHRIVRRIDGAGETEPLVDQLASYPHSWSPDGRVLAFYERVGGSADNARPRDISTLSVDDGERQPFVESSFNERSPSFSPDGRYIAYTSDESGEDQIYIQAFPGPGAKIAVSRSGGHEPVWARNGSELFFRHGSEVWAAAVRDGSPLEVSEPTLLFDGPYLWQAGAGGSQTYDVAADGRFLMVKRDDVSTSRLVIVLNWTDELKRLVPVAP